MKGKQQKLYSHKLEQVLVLALCKKCQIWRTLMKKEKAKRFRKIDHDALRQEAPEHGDHLLQARAGHQRPLRPHVRPQPRVHRGRPPRSAERGRGPGHGLAGGAQLLRPPLPGEARGRAQTQTQVRCYSVPRVTVEKLLLRNK